MNALDFLNSGNSEISENQGEILLQPTTQKKNAIDFLGKQTQQTAVADAKSSFDIDWEGAGNDIKNTLNR